MKSFIMRQPCMARGGSTTPERKGLVFNGVVFSGGLGGERDLELFAG